MSLGKLICQVFKMITGTRKSQARNSDLDNIMNVINTLGGSTVAMSVLSMLLKRGKSSGGLGRTGSLVILGAMAYCAYQQRHKKLR